MKQRFGVSLAGLLVLGLASGAFAQAQAPAAACDDTGKPIKRVTRLGNPGSSMHRPPLRTMADFKKLLDNKRYVADVGSVLSQACMGANTTMVLEAARTGEVREVTVAPGTNLKWMGSRKGRGTRVIRPIVWAGKAPFEAFEFKTTIGDSTYTFLVPKACGNFTLADVQALPTVSTSARISCARDNAGNPTTTVNAASTANLTSVSMTCGGNTAELNAANNWTASFAGEVRDGGCTVSGKDSFGRAATGTPSYTPCPALAPPPPAPTCTVNIEQTAVKKCWNLAINSNKPGTLTLTKDGAALAAPALAKGATVPGKVDGATPATVSVCQQGTYTAKVAMDGADATCEASTTLTSTVTPAATMPFVGAFFGKERRTLEAFPGGRCAPIGGPHVGIGFRPGGGDFEIAPVLGFAANFRGDDDDSSSSGDDHSVLYADVELNKHFDRAFIGTGLTLWDLTHGDDFMPGALAQFGLRLNSSDAKNPFYWVNQGRVFFNDGGVSNNYMVWTGFRLMFGKN
jgi:hypothetical protein